VAQGGIEGVRAEIGRAERRIRSRAFDDPPQGLPRKINGEDVKPGEWTPGADGLPPDCPVKPLGREGNWLHVVDAKGQLISLKPTDMGQAQISALFHDRDRYLYWAWPRWSKDRGVEGWRAEKVREALYHAAGPMPLFSASNHVRGRGAWLDGANERLVYHSGDALWTISSKGKFGLEEAQPGLRGREFYELLPSVPAPWPERIQPADNPAREILRGLRSWHWERPDVDPILMLGWIGAAVLSGALEWRPNLYVTGDKATGKSQMLTYVKTILGDGLIKSADASAAGVTQKLRHDALPVALDELEAEADQRATNAILKLAKIASSGDGKLRGGADHTGVEFTLRSCFVFSSINPPGLRPEDVSRMAILRLRPLAEQPSRLKEAPSVDKERTGSMVLRVLMDNWDRFPAAIAAYFEVLRLAGHPDRGQKTFGTLLACADLMLGPELADELDVPMVDDLSPWGERLAVSAMAEYEDMTENWRACFKHLLTSRVEAWRAGKQHTVGQLLDEFRASLKSEHGEGLSRDKVNEMLAQAGLRLIWDQRLDPDPEGFVLAVPNESQLVAQQYRETRWVGQAGASVWKSALRQGPPAVIVTDKSFNRVRINGSQERCTLVRLRAYETF
jgi:hypothetical protein